MAIARETVASSSAPRAATLGAFGGDHRRPARISVEDLIDGRACVVGNSGAGKSYLIRRLLEQTHGLVQHIVLDGEDEFFTLRDAFDYVLIGGDQGDVQLPAMSDAPRLAKSLLELGVSAIVQMNDLDLVERRGFVQAFLHGLLSAPRSAWHPTVVVIDEAHQYAPQSGGIVPSRQAVSRLMSQGRKRSLAGVLATQRLSKLNKDCTGEVQNWFIGRVGQSLDRRAAMDQLGFAPSGPEAQALMRAPAGRFWAFGPAIAPAPELMTVGEVETRHLRAGQRDVPTPPPPARVREALAALAAQQPAVDEARPCGDQAAVAKAEPLRRKIRDLEAERVGLKASVTAMTKEREAATGILRDLQERIAYHFTVQEDIERARGKLRPAADPQPSAAQNIPELIPRRAQALAQKRESGGGARRMLEAVVWAHPASLTKTQVALLAGLSARGGTFSTYLSRLKGAELIEISGNAITATSAALQELGGKPELPAFEERLARWKETVGPQAAGRLLDVVVDGYPDWIPREELAARCGLEPTGGTFSTYISRLAAASLIQRRPGAVRAASELFVS